MSHNQNPEQLVDSSETAQDDNPTASEADGAVTAKQLATLEAENERLREAVSIARRRRYRFTALGFALLGLIAIGGAVVFVNERTVLLALGGTGIFGAVLTYFLTPERFVAAAVGERIYGTLAGNEAAIVADLALDGEPTIVPTEGSAAPARLFVARAPEGTLPDAAELSVPFVTGAHPGLSIEPTGVGLYEELTDSTATLPEAPAALARTVGDALVEQFELTDGVEINAEAERVTMAVDGSVYGPVDRFDHPIASVLATTLAVELQRPVTVAVTDGDRADWFITCRFESSENNSVSSAT